MTEPGSPTDRTPNRGSDGFDCPRCGAFAHQTWFELKREVDNQMGDVWTETADDARIKYIGGSEPWSGVPTALTPEEARKAFEGVWAMSQCGRCRTYSTWRGDQLMFPTGASYAPQPSEDMPEEAEALYREAAAVVGISRRAGAALARASLERALRELDPVNGNLDLAKRIDRVLDKVSPSLGQMLTVIRHIGNKSLHVEDEPDDAMVLILNPDDSLIVEQIFGAINDVVFELRTKPNQAQEAYSKVPERIRDQVGKSQQGVQ